MQKIYSRINWENEPSTNTAVSEDNLNKMDYALDQLDDRVINLAGYEERAKASEESAGDSASNAAQSEANALQYSKDSLNSANAAKDSENKSLEYSNAAATSATNAEKSNQESKQNADEAALSAEQSAQSKENACTYAESAKANAEQINGRIDDAESAAQSAEQSAQNASAKSLIADEKASLAEQYVIMAESFTHGGTGARENEVVDNAQYYLEQAKQISQSMNGLIPMGTISFEDLALAVNQVNKYMFNISNDFITDDTFKEGAGHAYPAGVNVFRTNDGYWDCLAGSFQTPNGDTKDNVTTFVPASTRTNIASGEKHSIIFGKIAKFFADLKTVAFTGSYKDLSDKPSASDVGAVATDGDIAENTVVYMDATTLTELASGEKVGTAFAKIKLAVKNVISILKLLGNTDISKIGDGTVTGILSTLNSDLGLKQDAATAITTSNIAIQSVNYADSAGNASELGGNAASAFSAANHNHNTAYLARTEWGRASGKLLQTYNHTIGSYSIKGGDKVDISSKNLAISGYTSLGIVGYECSDKRLGVTHCALTDAGVFSGTLRNFASSEYNGTLYVKVLYIKNI